MKKSIIILLAFAVATAMCVSCDKEGGKDEKKTVTKLVKLGNRSFEYDDQGRITAITEHDGEDFGKTLFEYDGNTAKAFDEQSWGDWYQEPKLTFVFTLNDKGYATALTHKKDAGDFNYKFEYDAAGYLVKGIYCDGNQDVVIFTRTIADKCATAYIQSKRYFEYGADWEKATVENAKENIRYTDTLNEDNFFAEYIDYRRNPDNGDLKLEKMFFYAGLFGKASAKLPEEAVWTNNDGSALPTDYYETTVDYAYTFDDEGHIAGFSVDGGGNVTEVAWETITLK